MNGIQNLIVIAALGIVLLITIPVLTLALTWLTHPNPVVRAHRRSAAWILTFVTVAMVAGTFEVLKTAPAFDFINRCRPAGAGTCLTGESYAAVAQAIQVDLWQTALTYLITPLLVATILASSILRRRI